MPIVKKLYKTNKKMMNFFTKITIKKPTVPAVGFEPTHQNGFRF